MVNLIIISAYKFGTKNKVVNNNTNNNNTNFLNNSITNANQNHNLNRTLSVSSTIARPNKRLSTTNYPNNNNNNNNSPNSNKNEPFLNPIVYKIRKSLCLYFITSIGFCDLFICLTNMPVAFFLIDHHSSSFSTNIINNLFAQLDTHLKKGCLCKMAYFLAQIPISIEIEILFLIALDRYSSVYAPMKHYFLDRNIFKLVLVFQLLFSTFLSVPNLFLYEFNHNNSTVNSYCIVAKHMHKPYLFYQIFLFTLFFMVLLSIIVCYFKVYRNLHLMGMNNAGNSNNNSNGSVSIQSRKESTVSYIGNIIPVPTVGMLKLTANTKTRNCRHIDENETLETSLPAATRRVSCPINEHPKLSITSHKPISSQRHSTILVMTKRSSSIKYATSANNACRIIGGRLRRFSENPSHNLMVLNPSSTAQPPPPTQIADDLISINNHAAVFTAGAGSMSMRRHIASGRKMYCNRTAKCLFIATLTFTLTWTPYWLLNFDLIKPSNQMNNLILKNTFYLNFILNPMFYSFANGGFRNYLCNFFQKSKKFFKMLFYFVLYVFYRLFCCAHCVWFCLNRSDTCFNYHNFMLYRFQHLNSYFCCMKQNRMDFFDSEFYNSNNTNNKNNNTNNLGLGGLKKKSSMNSSCSSSYYAASRQNAAASSRNNKNSNKNLNRLNSCRSNDLNFNKSTSNSSSSSNTSSSLSDQLSSFFRNLKESLFKFVRHYLFCLCKKSNNLPTHDDKNQIDII